GYRGIWTLVEQVKVHVDRYRRLTLPQEGRMERAIGEHAAIAAAIESGDGARAAEKMGVHLDGLLTDIPKIRRLNPDYFAGDAQARGPPANSRKTRPRHKKAKRGKPCGDGGASLLNQAWIARRTKRRGKAKCRRTATAHGRGRRPTPSRRSAAARWSRLLCARSTGWPKRLSSARCLGSSFSCLPTSWRASSLKSPFSGRTKSPGWSCRSSLSSAAPSPIGGAIMRKSASFSTSL